MGSPSLGKEVFQTQGHPYTVNWKLEDHVHERVSPNSPPFTPYSALKQQTIHTKSRTIAFLKLGCGVKSRVATEQGARRWLLKESVIYRQDITRITRKVKPKMINPPWRKVLNQEPQVPGLS